MQLAEFTYSVALLSQAEALASYGTVTAGSTAVIFTFNYFETVSVRSFRVLENEAG